MYRILIIEDEEMIRKGIRYSFPYESWNCIVVAEASNGVEGLALIEKCKPHIVITDITMPIMDGIQMMKECKTMSNFIVISGYDEFSYVQEAMKLGATAYLLKPVIEEELKKAIDKAILAHEMKKSFHKEQAKKSNMNITDVLEGFEMEEDDVVKKMIQYVHDHYAEKIVMEQVCVSLHYSEALLNRRFKKATKLTFNEYVNRYRVSMAIEKMKLGEQSITVISYACGFQDYKYFNQVFHKYVGCSMKEFIKDLEEVLHFR